MSWTRREKFNVTTYLETKPFKPISKIDATNLYDNNVLLRQETLKNSLHTMEANMLTVIKRY